MIKDCDPFCAQKIAHDLRFVGWGIVVEERSGHPYMDISQFKACAATIDRYQAPGLSSSNGFTFPLFIYSNTNSDLFMFLTLILGTKVPQSLFLQLNLCGRSPCVTHSDEKLDFSLMNVLGLL
jgi:hypothetical protein